jgi:hypothetical protein
MEDRFNVKDRSLLIPIYGLIKGLSEYNEVGRRHDLACKAHTRNPTPENYKETWKWFDRSWPAMDNALIGLWSTIGELMIMVI